MNTPMTSPEQSTSPSDERPLGFWLRSVDHAIKHSMHEVLAEDGLGRRSWRTLELIAGGATDPEEVIMGLRIIQKESSRLTQMVEELLDFTRLESGRMKLNVELFDVGAELYEAVYMYQNMLEKENIQLIYDIPDQMCPVSGDRHRLKQVFLNIIDNAAKYGKSGGKIEIVLSRDSYTVRIDVRDWGVGIKEDELPFVKEKFYKGSSKQRGNGIGLAVTDEIVRMHGGTLNIASKYGEGTVVTVSLPLANADSKRVEPTEGNVTDTKE